MPELGGFNGEVVIESRISTMVFLSHVEETEVGLERDVQIRSSCKLHFKHLVWSLENLNLGRRKWEKI